MRAIKQTEKNTKAIPCHMLRICCAGHDLNTVLGNEASTKPIRHNMPAVFRLKRRPKNNAIGTSA